MKVAAIPAPQSACRFTRLYYQIGYTIDGYLAILRINECMKQRTKTKHALFMPGSNVLYDMYP